MTAPLFASVVRRRATEKSLRRYRLACFSASGQLAVAIPPSVITSHLDPTVPVQSGDTQVQANQYRAGVGSCTPVEADRLSPLSRQRTSAHLHMSGSQQASAGARRSTGSMPSGNGSGRSVSLMKNAFGSCGA